MTGIEVGQVLTLKIRFDNTGTISQTRHPYLVIDVDNIFGIINVAQFDSLAGKEYKAAFRSSKVVYADNPKEAVLDKDSYIVLDNTILIEYCPELLGYRRQTDKLSEGKLKEVIKAYQDYHKDNRIDENKQVYMDRNEVIALQS